MALLLIVHTMVQLNLKIGKNALKSFKNLIIQLDFLQVTHKLVDMGSHLQRQAQLYIILIIMIQKKEYSQKIEPIEQVKKIQFYIQIQQQKGLQMKKSYSPLEIKSTSLEKLAVKNQLLGFNFNLFWFFSLRYIPVISNF